jgi:hypothetical protein
VAFTLARIFFNREPNPCVSVSVDVVCATTCAASQQASTRYNTTLRAIWQTATQDTVRRGLRYLKIGKMEMELHYTDSHSHTNNTHTHTNTPHTHTHNKLQPKNQTTATQNSKIPYRLITIFWEWKSQLLLMISDIL